MSANFTTPKRRSPHVGVTPESNCKTRTCTINNLSLSAVLNNSTPTLTPSTYSLLPIQNSSVSYWVLLPHNIFCLIDDSDVVIVVVMESYAGQGNQNGGGRARVNRQTLENAYFNRRDISQYWHMHISQYCHMHGAWNHLSRNCNKNAPSHRNTATLANRMGGSNAFWLPVSPVEWWGR